MRRVTKDYPVPNRKLVLKTGTIVIIPIYAIQRDAEYYENPNEFIPERFEPDCVAKRPPFAYLPFGEGPRLCIGKRFGILQAKIALILLLKNFKFTIHEATKMPIEYAMHTFLLTIKGDLYLNVEKI